MSARESSILAAPPVDLPFVDQAVARHGGAPDAVIPILQELQEHYHYLPEPALRRVCETTNITPAALWGVATFYSQFRHKPAGKHIVRICHGTACHVKGADLLEDALRRHLKMESAQETDAAAQFTLERVGCLGCCTLAPVAQVNAAVYGHLTAVTTPAILADVNRIPAATTKNKGNSHVSNDSALPQIRIGVGSCCVAGGSMAVREALDRAAGKLGITVGVKPVGCVGMCHQTPLVEVLLPGRAPILYTKVAAADAEGIVLRHFRPHGLLRRASLGIAAVMDRLLMRGDVEAAPVPQPTSFRAKPVDDFLGRQVHLATETCGELDPLDVDEYISHGGFKALRTCLDAPDSTWIIEQFKQSQLRGRGGAGFPTGLKWERARAAVGSGKYVVCNGDEGDPGAFMDRMILESYPYRVIEGMIIAALAVGATEGLLYIRHEYPLAVKRIDAALEICIHRGILGPSIMGTGRALTMKVMQGAGAFVCGEETALIASVEGRRGMPRLRPPFPVDRGLWGKPTCINNVETLALVPWIIRHGAPAFAAFGTAKSKGTKVFALTGKIQRGGLIEVPIGITLRQIVEEIGGGVAPGRTFKAVQIGGPSGGCIPAEMADISVDYESLASVGAIMGSGGMVVMDDRDCMVDIARYFLKFTQAESCGKCTFCRVGTQRMLDLLNRLCDGRAKKEDLRQLEELCATVKCGSLCGLGQTAPNPVLTTLKYFRSEYEAHLEGRCPAGRCQPLIRYEVKDDCIGCTRCAQQCPVGAIAPKPYEIHRIDADKCTCCDICRTVCPSQSIVITSNGTSAKAPGACSLG